MTVTKSDLALKVAKELEVSIEKTGRIIDSMMSGIEKSLANGKDVQLTGFGTSTTPKRKARTGRNPQNGKSIKIPAKTVPKFRAGKDLHEAVGKKKSRKK